MSSVVFSAAACIAWAPSQGGKPRAPTWSTTSNRRSSFSVASQASFFSMFFGSSFCLRPCAA